MKKRSILVVACALTAGLVGMMPTAHASVPTGTGANGFDGIGDLVVGGGSDTTYVVEQQIGDLYNNAKGCELNLTTPPFQCNPTTSSPPPVADQSPVQWTPALPGAQPYFGNYDHDTVAQATPYGSGAGIGAVCSGGSYAPAIDFARSSRGPSGSELTNCSFWGYGQDGIVVESYGRTPTNLTTAQLVQIYTCAVTDWSGFGFPAGPIQVWGMNAKSGTYGTFNTYIKNAGGLPSTFDIDSQSCVKKLSDGTFPLENDSKLIINDPGFDNANAIWWGSLGEFLSFSYKRQTAKAWKVDNKTANLAGVFGLTYPITRVIYHVTKNADADCVPSADPRVCTAQSDTPAAGTDNPVPGATSGKGGAVREYTRALCRVDSSSQSTDVYTGKNLFDEVSSTISKNNFTPVNDTLRTPGYRCQVLT